MTVQMQASLSAETLSGRVRKPFHAALDLDGAMGRTHELRVPDGTLAMPLLSSLAGQVTALVVTCDKAVQIWGGDAALNQPLTLAPGGMYALAGCAIPQDMPWTLRYTPGDGSSVTCVVLALTEARILTGCARFEDHPTLAQGLLHCWELDEQTGARHDHVSGLTMLEGGTPTGITPGKIGQASVFTGTNWLVSDSADASLVNDLLRPPFTLAFWMWIDAYPTTESWCLVATGNNLSANQYYFYCIVRHDDHRIQMSLMQGFGGVVSAVVPPSLGAWHLVVGWSVPSGTGNVGPLSTHLQIDNGAIATVGPGGFQFPWGAPLVVGAIGNPGTSARLRGRVDQVMYWNRALTSQAERDEIWNGGRG